MALATPPAFPTRRESLGKLAAVLLPLDKLKTRSPRGLPFEIEVHDFLLATFHGYTVSSGNISGHWQDDSGRDEYGEHREYKVALPTGSCEQELEVFLGTLGREMREDYIYVELGSEVFLIPAEGNRT